MGATTEWAPHQNSSKLHPPTLNDDKMVNETAIKLAIADLESQERPNFAATAQNYRVSHQTLQQRFKREAVSHQEAHSLYKKNLTTAQEEVLLDYISTLSACGIPPTP